MFCRKDIDDVATDAEGAAVEIQIVALVLHVSQALDDRPLIQTVAHTHRQDHVVVFVAVADAVDAGHRGDNHHIPALDQALGCR